MNKKIEISTLNISVNVLMLDNKRFTKSIFNQLPLKRLFTYDLLSIEDVDNYFRENDIIGYVDNVFKHSWSSHQRCYLINCSGCLYRSADDDYVTLLDQISNKSRTDYNEERRKVVSLYLHNRMKGIGQIFISC